YRSTPSMTQLTWFDRAGHIVGTMGAPDEHSLLQPRLSPDGHTVVVYRTQDGKDDLWLIDTARSTRLTSDPSMNEWPLWSPDGHQIAFTKLLNGIDDLYVKLPDAAGSEELLWASSENKAPLSWSPDGQFLLFTSRSSQTGGDMWVLPLQGERKPFAFL